MSSILQTLDIQSQKKKNQKSDTRELRRTKFSSLALKEPFSIQNKAKSGPGATRHIFGAEGVEKRATGNADLVFGNRCSDSAGDRGNARGPVRLVRSLASSGDAPATALRPSVRDRIRSPTRRKFDRIRPNFTRLDDAVSRYIVYFFSKSRISYPGRSFFSSFFNYCVWISSKSYTEKREIVLRSIFKRAAASDARANPPKDAAAGCLFASSPPEGGTHRCLAQ